MSTDFLNRRMDLKHTSLSENYLTMDTSYPVKLAGKVVKIFTASSDFNTNKWILENSDREIILTVESDNVYDFAGRVIKNSIGAGKAYSENINVFKQDDYVMVIIDFDNKNLHLCSQTNFENFIVGVGDECEFKLFDITGDTEVEGFEYPIDTDVFDKAVEFESEPGKHSLVRSEIDKVVYQAPKNKDGSRRMTPVSNINILNINALNTSIQNLIFPFISLSDLNQTISGAGFENITGIFSFRTINGFVNDEFIKDYCFTKDEMIQTGLFKASGLSSNYLDSEYKNIPDEDKDKYLYVLKVNVNYNNKNFDSDVFNDSFVFIPIRISDKKFASFSSIDNGGIKCGDQTVSIYLNSVDNDLVGTWWGNDISSGFCGYYYDGDIIGIFIQNENLNLSSYPYSMYINNNRSGDNIRIAPADFDYEKLFNLPENKAMGRFIDFFAFDNSYNNFIKSQCVLGLPNVVSNNSPVFVNTDNIKSDCETPKCIITIYPECFENVLFDTNEDGSYKYKDQKLNNFNSFYNNSVSIEEKDFNRVNYQTVERYSMNNRKDVKYLLYELFDHDSLTGNLIEIDDNTNTNKTIQMTGNLGYQKLKYIANRSLVGRSKSNFINANLTSDGRMVMMDFVTRIIPASIKSPYKPSDSDELITYNNAEIGHQTILVKRLVLFANEHIKLDDDGIYKIYPNTKDFTGDCYELLTAIEDSSSHNITLVQATKDNFKNTTSTNKNMMYLYYKASNSFYRIKYYYDNNDTETNDDKINSYDYYSSFLLFTFTERTTSNVNSSSAYFVRAYMNYYMSLNHTFEDAVAHFNELVADDPSKIINEVIKAYKFYPINVSASENDNVYYNSKELKSTNTVELSIGLDTTFVYPAKGNNITDVDKDGFRLKDLIGDNYVVYQNSMAPYVSNTKDSNGLYVYDLASYVKYIKSKNVSSIFKTGEFPYLNGIGIRDCYYKDKSVYEFFNYICTRDLSKPLEDPESFVSNKIGSSSIAFIRKDAIIDTTTKENKLFIERVVDSEGTGYINVFKDKDGNNVNVKSSSTLLYNINTKNLFGFNKSVLIDTSDITSKYIKDDVIFINEEQAGEKTTYSISVNDGNVEIPSLLNINGTIGDIETDNLTWEILLLALGNNKSINILSDSLTKIKKSINSDFIEAGQNINDMITIDDSITDEDALKHDDIYDNLDESIKAQYYKEHNAEFDEKHNVYKFNYGYGFDDGFIRKVDNRGVIVFVTEGSYTEKLTYGGVTPDKYGYNFHKGNIYPKRMYISKDGLICTKEYFEKEINETNDYQTQINELQRQIDALKTKIGDVYANLMQSVWKFNDVVNLSIDMKDGDTTNEQVTALREQNSTLRDTTYDDISSVANAIYSYNSTIYNYINGIKTSTEHLNNLKTCNNNIKASTSNDSLVSNIKAYNTELIDYLFDIKWISNKEDIAYYNNNISI